MDAVRSLFIPVESGNLLIPNAAIAEVINLVDPAPLTLGKKKIPAWVLGTINWRDQVVPLISFDVLIGDKLPLPVTTARTVVLKAQKNTAKLPYFAIVAQKIPRLVTVFEESIELLSEDDVKSNEYELCQALANGEPASIPDIEKLEQKVLKLMN